jgi:predicted nucleotidyltransferase
MIKEKEPRIKFATATEIDESLLDSNEQTALNFVP